jgi:VanZ family protein
VNASPPSPRATAWAHWYRRILPAYWIFLFCTTHLPNLHLTVAGDSKGRSAHLWAFGLLAFLFWRFAETFRRPLSGRFVWVAAPGLVLYAAVDEYLQQFTGRSTNLGDWLCNVVAIAAVLGVLEWRRRVASREGEAPAEP